MPVSDHQLIQAWQQVLTLSRLGAVVNRLDLPPVNGEKALSRDSLAYLGTTPLTGNRAAIAALKASDLVLDLMTLLFSAEQHEILAAGTKILLAVEPPEVLVRMVPTESDRTRVLAATGRISRAKTMHVTSRAGTDLHCPLGEFPAIAEYGYVDQKGRWDHWPSGFALTWPNERQAHGTIVIDRGDILLPQKCYVTEPVKLTVKDGFAVDIEGGLHAELLAQYMASFRDLEAYAISHIGWGLQPRANWTALGLYDREATIGMDARAFEGNFLFSLGPNNEAGGTRTTACHIDIPLRHCTVRLDGQDVVRDGKVLD